MNDTPQFDNTRRGRSNDGPKLPRRLAYALTAYIIGLSLFASVTPSPLYHRYSELWHFSSLTLTLVYATYAIGVLVALLVAGRVSDDAGRRPVLLVAIGALLVATAIFYLAPSVEWLFIARGLQGVATGVAIGSASAAMLELHPRQDGAGVGLVNSVASTAGISLGLLISAVLVEVNWQPLMLPYLVLFVLFVVAFAGAIWMPETVPNRRRMRLTFERPQVPAAIRGPFSIAALTILASWSLGGLNFSLGPQLGVQLLGSTNAVIANSGVIALTAVAALSQVVLRRTAPWLSAFAGSIALAVGVLLINAAAATLSGPLYLIGSLVSGVGFGLASLGGLRILVVSIPAHNRAAVMSAYYIVAYASISVPAVIAGLFVGRLGVEVTFEAVAVVVALIALVVTVAAWRARPAARSIRNA